MELTKTFRFEASHVLPKHPGKCSRLHGHSWVLHVSVSGPINPDTGFVQDFAEISSVVKPLVDRLDHHHLGTWESMELVDEVINSWHAPGIPLNFYPTSENLLIRIAELLYDNLAWSSLSLEETCTSRATLTREEFDASKL